ncbi:unnamed protein product [Schistosoma rodhaini]|uniref:2Fe-2S ferredoxin-type domain-containing protein n=1 Tax=Schistosoma rodhaini TaxID=6188 RepID=A0AA85GD34_9TREM|nr:unnamed protein product [Schistosoma rodhaini]
MLSLLRLARCSLRNGSVLSLSRSVSGQPKKCVNITFSWKNGRNKTVYAKVGDNLLDVVLDNDVDIDGFGACEGTLACSTCHLIFAKEDFDNLRDPLTEEEQDMLDLAYGLTDTLINIVLCPTEDMISRLGCQVKVNEDMDGIVDNIDIRSSLRKPAKPILKESVEPKNPDFKQQRKNKNISKLKKYKKRQLKKKHASRQWMARKSQVTNERKTPNETQEEALNYLRMWHDDHKNWKFKKLPQSWLIKNALDRKMIPSSEFRIFKLYIKGLVGCARQDLLSQCSKIIEEQTDALETNTELVNRGDMSPDNIIGQQKSSMFRP